MKASWKSLDLLFSMLIQSESSACSVALDLSQLYFSLGLSCTAFLLRFNPISCRTVVHVYSSEQILCFNNLGSFLQSLADLDLNTSHLLEIWFFLEQEHSSFVLFCVILSHPACNLSELSSLHEGETGFHQIYRTVQKKALPPILDHEAQLEPQRSSDNRSPEPRHHRDNLPSPQRHRGDREPEPGRSQDEPHPQRRYSDDPPPSSQSSRPSRNYRQQNHREEENHSRCSYLCSFKMSLFSLDRNSMNHQTV